MFTKRSFLLLASLLAASTAFAGETITREFPWDGSESLTIDVPAHVRFVQTPGPGKVVVTGPRKSIESFSCAGGILRDRTLRTGTPLEVVVTAPKITRFHAKGDDRLAIEAFDQETLEIETTGRADVTAGGRATTLTLNLQGFGWANLSQLEVQGAEVALTGSRSAVIAPKTWARLSGQGAVVLLTKPETLTQDFRGGGRVIHTRP